MSSIRTVSFKDASIKWNTATSYDIQFDHNLTVEYYRRLIKNKIKVKKYLDIRRVVYNLVYEHIKSGQVKTMRDLIYLILALRLTEIDESEVDNDGNFKVYLLDVPEYMEKCTFCNIRYHINNHNRQMYTYCRVQVVSVLKGRTAISYTTGEWRDIRGGGLDTSYLKSKYSTKKYKNDMKYFKKRKDN